MWNAEDPDDEPLAMVVRTNYNTTMGSMARELLAPVRLKQANPFIQVPPLQTPQSCQAFDLLETAWTRMLAWHDFVARS